VVQGRWCNSLNEGQIPSWPPAAHQTAMGVWHIQSQHEGGRAIELVEQQDVVTLIPIIQRIIAPGTTIWSDEWAAYSQLSSLGFVHETVNCSRHFKAPQTCVCTNHVEAYWNAVKLCFKQMVGTSEDMVSSHLDEHMWHQWFGSTEKLAYMNMKISL